MEKSYDGVDFGASDWEKSSAWTDEGEHEAWRKMSMPERFKHVNGVRRKLAWFVTQQEADMESGLQPDARNDKLPDDIRSFLQEHQLRHIPHFLTIVKCFF